MPVPVIRLQLSALILPAILVAPQAWAAEAEDSDTSTIRVVGYADPLGLLPDQTAPKAVSAVSSDFIIKQAPTLNAFQLVSMLPGANVSTTDPYGLSPYSSLTLRGLGQDAIGVVLEGAPQNDIGYFYAYPSQFADAENLRQIALSQGTVDIDAPVVAAAGGLLSLTLDNPKNDAGALVNLSVGSYSARRAFVRVDTGEIAKTGIKAFVSYSNNRADAWRGAGFDKRQHVDAKLLTEWGDSNRASVAFSYNDANTQTYRSPTLADWQDKGRKFNYNKRYTEGDTEYWRLYRGPFRNFYTASPLHLKLSETLDFDNGAYLQFGQGNSPYGTQLTTTGNYLGNEEITDTITLPGAVDGVATVLGNYTGKQFRVGDVAKLTWQINGHRITAGLWFDYGTDRVTQTYTSIGADGRPVDGWGKMDKAIRTPDGRLLAFENARTVTVTKGFFLADSIALAPKLTVDLGFKGVNLLRNGRNYLPGPQSKVRYDAFAALPRAAVRYQLDDRQQVFANVTTNFRAPNEFALYDSYWGGEVYGKGSRTLKNEYAVSQELGYRYIGPSLSFSLTAFHYRFRNRQVATVVNSGGALANSTINAGSQTSYGLDGEINYRPAEGVSIYASGEYLHTRLNNDIPVEDDFLPTKGKRAVQAPSFQFALGTTYDDGMLFGSTAFKMVGRQYSSLMNDESIKGYGTLDVSIGIHLAGLIDAKRTDLRLNAINLTNPRVLSGVQIVSNNALDTVGRNGTIIGGSAPSYYVGSGRAFVATLSRAF